MRLSPVRHLLCFPRIVQVRLQTKQVHIMDSSKKWVKRWKNWVAPTKLPGVWKRKEGGYLVRARVIDPATGRMREIKRVMADVDEAAAFTWLSEEKVRIKAGLLSAERPRTRFADFAVSLLERKAAKREIKSARGRERWGYTLRHLIGGTRGVQGFGELFMDQIRVSHIEEWQVGIAGLITAGDYEPTTANGWLAILRVIFKAARRELGLSQDPTDGVRMFDTSEHATYTEEEPNALNVEEARQFLTMMREEFPRYYAMTYLGFATGLRPSSMRPLRRKGPTPDIRWDDGVILVRRSHTLGEEVMETTKTGLRQRINAPPELMEVLRWHVSTQLVTDEQQASDLLFPRSDGGFRSEACLRKPFAEVRRMMGLGQSFTPRGLRRTFNDMARAAKVESLVTKSISGHLTDRMKDHYSTVSPVEQRESIGRVLHLVSSPVVDTGPNTGGAPGGAPGVPGGAPTKKAG